MFVHPVLPETNQLATTEQMLDLRLRQMIAPLLCWQKV
jgi:hypothetical protein